MTTFYESTAAKAYPPPYPLPVSYTRNSLSSGVSGERAVEQEAQSLGYLTKRSGIEYLLSLEELYISGRRGIKWPSPDLILTLNALDRVDQFVAFVRGQSAYYPPHNFAVNVHETNIAQNWWVDHGGCSAVFAFISWTGSVHIALARQIVQYGVLQPGGSWCLINARAAGLPTLADVRRDGLPMA